MKIFIKTLIISLFFAILGTAMAASSLLVKVSNGLINGTILNNSNIGDDGKIHTYDTDMPKIVTPQSIENYSIKAPDANTGKQVTYYNVGENNGCVFYFDTDNSGKTTIQWSQLKKHSGVKCQVVYPNHLVMDVDASS